MTGETQVAAAVRAPSRKTLLIRTYAGDVEFTALLLRRIGRLNGWGHFSRLVLYLDDDGLRDVVSGLMPAEIPASFETHVLSDEPGLWARNKPVASWRAYRAAVRFGDDIVRLDPDLFIASPAFFVRISVLPEGFAGKVIPFYGPLHFDGRQVQYIQGGVTCAGPAARRYLERLPESRVARFVEGVEAEFTLPAGATGSPPRHLLIAEDLILTGPLADEAGVLRQHIAGLQASPHEVLRAYRNKTWTAADLLDSFTKSGAGAYHYEGSHQGRRALMHEMLRWAYAHTG